MGTVLGIDVGGSGSRLAFQDPPDAAGSTRHELRGERVGITTTGSTIALVVEQLLRSAAENWPAHLAQVQAIGLGATGLGTLVNDHRALVSHVRRMATESGIGAANLRVAIAIDAVTAHLGALNGGSGAMVALGTGAVALGGDGRSQWRRVDGWGHLLGDRGSGAAIGQAALTAALEAFDGVAPDGNALLAAARARFGNPYSWPSQFYTRDDRAGVLASFVPDVVAVAEQDATARHILTQAGIDSARSALAALTADLAPRIALTGGVARSALVATSFADTVHALRPDIEIVTASGDPLSGAILLAEKAHRQELSAVDEYVWL